MKVIINRGQGNKETIIGEVINESTTHYRIFRKASKTDSEVNEWFAKSSAAVNCEKQGVITV